MNHMLQDEKKNTVIAFLLICLALIVFPFIVHGYWLRVVTGIFMFATITCALNFIAGFAGYAAFGNVVFMGIGAYTTAILMVKTGVPWWIGVIAGAVLSSAFAILLGLPILRLKGHYFAIATLGLAEATKALVQNLNITEGNSGLYLPMPNISLDASYRFFY